MQGMDCCPCKLLHSGKNGVFGFVKCPNSHNNLVKLLAEKLATIRPDLNPPLLTDPRNPFHLAIQLDMFSKLELICISLEIAAHLTPRRKVISIIIERIIRYGAAVSTAVEDGVFGHAEQSVIREIPQSSNITTSFITGHVETTFEEIFGGHEAEWPGADDSNVRSHETTRLGVFANSINCTG